MTSSAARRSNSHQGPAAGSGGSHPSSLLQTSSLHASHGAAGGAQGFNNHGSGLHSSGGGGGPVNYPHPRLTNSARKSGQHQGHSFGGLGGSALSASHMPSATASGSENKGMSSGFGVAHTDFNQVSQFSLSSLKDQNGGHNHNGNAAGRVTLTLDDYSSN